MSLQRLPLRFVRIASNNPRFFSTGQRFLAKADERHHPNVDEHRQAQKEKPLGPHFTNTNSTISNEMPSIGKDKPPPELLTSVDPDFVPKDSVPENTERMTGKTQKPGPENGPNAELGVGEMEGAKFKVEPLRRTGEDANTMRARLLCPLHIVIDYCKILLISSSWKIDQSRKRGTLESDLLLSTFADANLAKMNLEQLRQYDLFMDENDWDIYYWATQEPSPTSRETAEGSGPDKATPTAQGSTKEEPWRQAPRSGEWAQTVGTFKPAYRPVPARWQGSEILAMLRKHVIDRSAGGLQESEAEVSGKSLAQSVTGTGGRGLGRMPAVQNFDT